MLSIQLNIESSIKEFDHSDKYILEKFSQIIAILIDEYKAEIEKFKRVSSITNIASLPEASYGLLGNELFIAFDPVTWTIIGVVVTIISIVVTVYAITTTTSSTPTTTTYNIDNNTGTINIIGTSTGNTTINVNIIQNSN